MHENEWYLNRMNNVLINEDRDQHNVRYLLRIIIQETKIQDQMEKKDESEWKLYKQLHVDERRDFVMSKYFDLMQKHVIRFLKDQVREFDGNLWFEQPEEQIHFFEN